MTYKVHKITHTSKCPMISKRLLALRRELRKSLAFARSSLDIWLRIAPGFATVAAEPTAVAILRK